MQSMHVFNPTKAASRPEHNGRKKGILKRNILHVLLLPVLMFIVHLHT